jgi:uncharacterized delta-60 repeat protein
MRRQGKMSISLAIGMTVLFAALAVAASASASVVTTHHVRRSGHSHPALQARLDPSFGVHGRVIGETFTKGYAYSTLAAVYPNGSIVALLGETISRYLPDGQLDPRFGEGGRIPLPNLEAARELLFPAAIAVDGEGRVLVAATRWSGEFSRLPGLPYYNNYRELATVIRYLPNGQLDPSFGLGGIASSDLGLPGGFNVENPAETFSFPALGVTSMALDRQGRIVLAGTYTTAVYGHCKYGSLGTNGAFVARLTPNGAPDPSFAGVSSATISDLIYEDATVAVNRKGGAVLGTAHPQAFGCGFPLPEDKFFRRGSIMRFSASGGADRRFSGNGVLQANGSVVQIAVDGSGRILTLVRPGVSYWTTAPERAEVLRLEPNGSLDHGFGKKGRVGLRGRFTAIAAGGHGTVLLGGGTGKQEAVHSRFLLVRLTYSGGNDRRFAPGGRIKTAFGEEFAVANSLLVDRGARPVLAGVLEDHSVLGSFPTLAIARYLVPR